MRESSACTCSRRVAMRSAAVRYRFARRSHLAAFSAGLSEGSRAITTSIGRPSSSSRDQSGTRASRLPRARREASGKSSSARARSSPARAARAASSSTAAAVRPSFRTRVRRRATNSLRRAATPACSSAARASRTLRSREVSGCASPSGISSAPGYALPGRREAPDDAQRIFPLAVSTQRRASSAMRTRSPNSRRGEATRRSRGTTSAAPDSRVPSSAFRSVACDRGALSGAVGRSGTSAANRSRASITARALRPGRRSCRTQSRGEGSQSLCSDAPTRARSSRSSRFRSSSSMVGGTAGLPTSGFAGGLAGYGRPPGYVRATSCASSSASSSASRPSSNPSSNPSFWPSVLLPSQCVAPRRSLGGTLQTPIRSVKHPTGLKQGGCGR